MSGGSFNYLCMAVDHDEPLSIARKLEDIKDMRDALMSEGATDAAEATGEIVSMIERFFDELESKASKLSPLWRAMEWYCSGDWGKDRLEDALEKWRSDLHPAAQTPWTSVAPAERKPGPLDALADMDPAVARALVRDAVRESAQILEANKGVFDDSVTE